MKHTIILFYMIVSSCSCLARGSACSPDSLETEENVLPELILSAIDECDSIKWMLIDPIAVDPTMQSYAIVGEVLSEVTDKNRERINALKCTIAYPKSFEDCDMRKDCTFLSDIAFVAYCNEQKLYFSYSFYCDLCRFEINSLKKEYDGEMIREAILQFSLEVFPKDRYLRRIAGVTR